jgi:hypothetical protein
MLKIANEIIAIANLVANEPNSLDGMSKVKATRFVNKLLDKHTRGFFTDTYWKPIHESFKELSKNNIPYELTESKYTQDSNGNPTTKRWKFTITFSNDKMRYVTLYGLITASGAGTVEDPLSRYDVTAYVS